MLYLMQLAIYSGVNTFSLPVMLIAMLMDGLENVTSRLAFSTYLYVCAEYVCRFPSELNSMITNILTRYGKEILRN